MSNLRRILPLLLCLSLLCACVQMPNAPKDETPLQSPHPFLISLCAGHVQAQLLDIGLFGV